MLEKFVYNEIYTDKVYYITLLRLFISHMDSNR